jgi:hypothetical protein
MERAYCFLVESGNLRRKAVENLGAYMETELAVGEGIQAGNGKSLPSLCDEEFVPQFCHGVIDMPHVSSARSKQDPASRRA